MTAVRTGVLLAAGVAAGRLMARTAAKMTSSRTTPRGDATWFVVTVCAPPEDVGADQRLSEAVKGLGANVETTLRPAPGDRGTEIFARVRDTASGSPTANDLRRALRQVKSLVETGELVRPDPPTTGKPTPGGALVRAATRRAGGEGRL